MDLFHTCVHSESLQAVVWFPGYSVSVLRGLWLESCFQKGPWLLGQAPVTVLTAWPCDALAAEREIYSLSCLNSWRCL